MHSGVVFDDRYVLARSLGERKDIEIWEVEHLATGRAKTLMLTPSPGDALFAQARAARLIDHPTVLWVEDVGVSADGTYLVTEPLSGEVLEDVLRRRGAIDRIDACRIAAAIFDSLAAAHDAEIAHGSLSSASVLVHYDDALTVKVLDYGAELPHDEITETDALAMQGDLLAATNILCDMLLGPVALEHDGASGGARPGNALEISICRKLEALGGRLDRPFVRGPEPVSARSIAAWLTAGLAESAAASLERSSSAGAIQSSSPVRNLRGSPRTTLRSLRSSPLFTTPEVRASRGMARLDRVVHADDDPYEG